MARGGGSNTVGHQSECRGWVLVEDAVCFGVEFVYGLVVLLDRIFAGGDGFLCLFPLVSFDELSLLLRGVSLFVSPLPAIGVLVVFGGGRSLRLFRFVVAAVAAVCLLVAVVDLRVGE